MSEELNQDDLESLVNLLLISSKVKAREALCIRIGISYYRQLGFINDPSEESFAINLINHLNDVGNTKAICQICCKELVPIFKGGQRESILKKISVKLNCNEEYYHNFPDNKQPPSPPSSTAPEFNVNLPNQLKESKSQSLFTSITQHKNILLAVVTIFAFGFGVYPAYEYLKQPSQLVEANRLKQTALLVRSKAKGDIGKYQENVVPLEPTDVNLRNFIVEAQFHNPYDGAMNNFTYGFAFKENTTKKLNDPQRKSFDIWISSIGNKWNFRATSIVLEDKLSNLNYSDNGSNKLNLTVKGQKANFFVNDKYITSFDISEFTNKGDIFLIAKDGISGKVVQYENLKVWSLDN
ncbi:hypothetical protein [uncultured Nostoc sp.]|uniref:hypothetical protein n=1 Tax=uncultured Nostoc sp. TaxID=340711 RepID=UPI0035CC846E